MTAADAYLSNNSSYAEAHTGPLPLPPSRAVAVVACMDARINVHAILGARPGEAHVIRNAGGVITDDVIRSLAISQNLLGTKEIILIHHTNCGMLTFENDEFRKQLKNTFGATPSWSPEAFGNLEEDVRDSMARIEKSPFVPHKDAIRGFIFDVASGSLREVT
ncbi:beta-class carbonic anhydrase [Streptomyces sp. 1222.5]|uniref:beta-class carbonic anhydrase n=1 Tax=Streptomyces sp. 1222.5 TaxID=1881026 RepID=UPI003EBEF576